MKYIAVLIFIVFVVRIDFFLNLYDRSREKLNRPSTGEITSDEVRSSRETISFTEDKTLKQTPKERFLALLGAFHVTPVSDIRVRAMGILKETPLMFGQKKDPELELAIYQWRDLLNNNEPELVIFLLDLLNTLQGQNQESVRKFFSLWMEINMENFIAAYSRTKDSNCNIAVVFGDPIPEEEKLNEYYERQEALKEVINKEKTPAVQKALATNCLTQLTLMIDKMKSAPPQTPPIVPTTPEPSPQAVPSP